MLRTFPFLTLNLLIAVATVGFVPLAGASDPCDSIDLCPYMPCELNTVCVDDGCVVLDGQPWCPTVYGPCVYVNDHPLCVNTPCSGLVAVAVLGSCPDGCDATVAVVAAFDSCGDRCFSDVAVVAVYDSCKDCVSEGLLVAYEDSCYEDCVSNVLLVALDDSCLEGCTAYTAIVAFDDSCSGTGCRAQVIAAILNSCNATDRAIVCIERDQGTTCVFVQ